MKPTGEPNKPALLVAFLATKGIDVDPDKYANQQTRCYAEEYHPKGDRNPSFSVNVAEGVARCFACPTKGDVYRLIELDRKVEFSEAVRWAETELDGGGGAVPPEPGRRESGLPGGARPWRPKHHKQVSPWSSGGAGQGS